MWFKVDDKLHAHSKPRRAGKAAVGVWVLAGSWSSDNETGGFIPRGVLPLWGTRSDAQRLVEAGLWHTARKNGEEGWRFHDWSHFQPSAAAIAAKRAAEREAGIRGNHKRWHTDRGITDPECEYCYRVPDGEPDNEPIGGPESAPNRPVPVPEPTTTSNEVVGASEPRADVLRICEYLATAIESNGSKRPTITKGWLDEARRMLDIDGRTEPEVTKAIDWCQRGDSERARFWRPNVMSMTKLRSKFDQMRLQAANENVARPTRFQEHMALVQQLGEQETPGPFQIGGSA